MDRAAMATTVLDTRPGESTDRAGDVFFPHLEDLEGQAREAFHVSRLLCESCRAYHAIYPYMRLAGRKRGVDADRGVLGPILTRLIADGARRILIAGSADPGVLALVLAAARFHPVAVTVVDLCPTPLVTCRSLGARLGIQVETEAVCLSQMTFDGGYDLVVAHSVLSFVSLSLHAAVADRIRAALVPGGRLVMASSVSAKSQPVDEAVFCADALAGLRANGVVLPTSESAFRKLLAGYSAVQRHRTSPATSTESLVAYLATHGLEVRDLIPKTRMVGYTSDGQCADHVSPGVIAVAQRA